MLSTNINHSSNSTGTPRNENATQKLIRENVDFLIKQLEAGRSDALTSYLTAMSHFHNYSFGNILQIARWKSGAIGVMATGVSTLLAGITAKQKAEAIASATLDDEPLADGKNFGNGEINTLRHLAYFASF